MRIVPIAGRTGRSVALALAVALAAGCDAEPDATEATVMADAPGRDASDAGVPPAPVPPPVAGPDADPGTGDGHGGDDPGGDADGDATVPSRFRGSYAANPAACDAAGNPTRLTVEADSIRFHESSGPITDVDSGPAEVTITAELTGEGETREATHTFRLSDDGGTLTDLAGGMERVRCN